MLSQRDESHKRRRRCLRSSACKRQHAGNCWLYDIAKRLLASAGNHLEVACERGKLYSSLAEYHLRLRPIDADALEKAKTYAKESIKPHSKQKNWFELFQSYRILADVCLAIGNSSDAERHLGQAESYWKLCPQKDEPRTRKLGGWLKRSKGNLRASQDNWHEALKEYDEAHDIFTNDCDPVGVVIAKVKLAVAHRKLGNRELAEEHLESAKGIVKLNPELGFLCDELSKIS